MYEPYFKIPALTTSTGLKQQPIQSTRVTSFLLADTLIISLSPLARDIVEGKKYI